MSLFNSIVTSALPILPKWFAKPFARPYVAGQTEDDAVAHIRDLNEKGFSATVDILGEHILTKEEARNITAQYCHLYDRIANESLDCNISIKPTHVGLNISITEAISNITTILKKAKDYENFLRIDMENSSVTDITINAYNNIPRSKFEFGSSTNGFIGQTRDSFRKFSLDGIFTFNESINS